MNSLPQTTIRLVSGSQTERERLLNRGRGGNQPSHAVLSCSLSFSPPCQLFSNMLKPQREELCAYVVYDLHSREQYLIGDKWQRSCSPWYDTDCMSWCQESQRGWVVWWKGKGWQVRAGQCQALLHWVDGQSWMVPSDFQEAWHLDLLYCTWNWID